MYYLSLEFLVGRLLRNAVCNLGIEANLTEAVSCISSSPCFSRCVFV